MSGRAGFIFLVAFIVLSLAFFAQATITPITPASPADTAWTNDSTPDFVFAAVSNVSAQLSCTVLVDNVSYGTNATVDNNTATTITANATLAQGSRSWYVSCIDADETENSTARILIVDTAAPTSTINSPALRNLTDATPDLNFTITDNVDNNVTYTVYVDGAVDQSSNISNDTATVVTLGFLANGTHTVNVQAADAAGNAVNSTQVGITIDTAAPTATINSPANDSWTSDNTPNSTITAVDNLADPISYLVWVNGTQDAAATVANNTATPVTLSALADGTHTVVVQATDGHGQAANSTELTIHVDTTNPNSTINSPATGANLTDATPDINFTLTDALDGTLAYDVFVDGSIDQSATATNDTATVVTLGFLTNGTHTVNVQATDEAGNAANSTQISITVDTAAPTAAITDPAGQSWTTDTTPNITISLTDETADPISYKIFVNDVQNLTGTAANNTATPLSLSTLAQGNHSVIVEATDGHGHSTNSTAISIHVDTTNPNSTINSPATGTNLTDATPDINFTITDNMDGVAAYTVYVDDAVDQSATVANNTPTVVTLGFLANGTHTINVQATDEAGNAVNSTQISITVDTAAPTATINSPANQSWSASSAVSLNFTLTDGVDSNLTYRIFVNGVQNATGSVDNNTAATVSISSLAQTQHELTVEATDDVGYATNATVFVTVDLTAPTSAINDPASGFNSSDSTPDVNFTLTDALDSNITYEVFVNGSLDLNGNVSNDTATVVTLSALADGTHTVLVRATDEAGWTANSSTISITIDTTAPTATISSPSNNTWTNDNTTEVTFTLTDALSQSIDYVVWVDGVQDRTGTADNNTATPVNLSAVSDGARSVVVQATDVVGNADNSTARTVNIDTTSPVIVLTSPAEAANLSDVEVSFNFTVTDNLDGAIAYTFVLDGAVNRTGTATNNTAVAFAVNVSQGAHNWSVNVTDDATNAQASATRNFTATDLVPPDNTTLTSVDDADTDGNVELAWASVAEASTYRVYRDSSNITNVSGLSVLATTSGTSFEDNTTAHGTTYWYAVTTLDAAGNENTTIANSLNAIADDQIAPVLPATVTATSNADGSVALAWTAVSQDPSGNADTLSNYYYVWRTTNVSALDTSNTSAALTNTTATAYTDTAMTTGTNYTYLVTAADDANNYNASKTGIDDIVPAACTTSYTYGDWGACSSSQQSRTGTRTCYGGGDTTIAETQACTSGGGGGGGGSLVEPSSAPQESERFGVMLSGSTRTWTLEKADIALTQVSFGVDEATAFASMQAERVESAPVSAGPKVYQYLKLTKSRLDSDKLSGDIELRFSVDQGWFSDNGAVADDVVLRRLVGDVWQDLPTRYAGKEGGKHSYIASTPDFSYFAVALRGSADEQPVRTEDEAPAAGEAPQSSEPGLVENTQGANGSSAVAPPQRSLRAIFALALVLVATLSMVAFRFHRLRKRHHH